MLVEAVEVSLAGLDLSGVEAEVAAVRMLAAELDLAPGDTDLWREFRMGLKALRGVTSDGGSDASIDELLGRLGGTDVRHTADTG